MFVSFAAGLAYGRVNGSTAGVYGQMVQKLVFGQNYLDFGCGMITVATVGTRMWGDFRE